MASKQYININDFDLFLEVVKSSIKVIDSAKFIIGTSGLEIYGARHKIARCEAVSNSITADTDISFSIENLQMFLKILQSVKDIHEGDYSKMKFSFDGSFIRFESPKFKTKFSACNENIIAQWISQKIDDSKFSSVFEFTTTSDLIKRMNSHSFMFSDAKSVRVYLETKQDMENNAVFATLGNRDTELNNEITLKFGLVNSGSLIEYGDDGLVKNERHIILDLERMNLLNSIQSNQIKVQLMNVNCLVCATSITGKNDTFFKFTVYSSILKN